MIKRGIRKKNISKKALRIVALILVFTFMVPDRAYAVGMLVDAGKQLLGGDEKKEEEIKKSDYADQYASEAEKLKNRLNSGPSDEKKKLRLSQAKTLAVAMSEKIEAVDMRIDAKTVKMQSAVRSLRERERSMGTVRWSPIFNIKLPEKPHEDEAFDFQFKPTKLQNEITMLKHKITEIELDSNEKVSNTYIKIISANNAVETLTARYKKLENAVAGLEVKVKLGTAALESKEDVVEKDAEGNEIIISPRILKARVKAAQQRLDNAQARLENCKLELTNARTTLEESKKKLGDMIGFTITDRFSFEDAFITANLNRDNVEYLYAYALEDDASVYEANMANEEALLTLRINYDLMKKQYAGYIGLLEPYIQQALDGVKIPKKAFKKDYDQFLKDIDQEWVGSYKIWFIKIPKEWLKGATDGIRYIEDDPYVLYSAALEYESTRKELENAKMELYNNIYDSYSNYASTRKAYLNANSAYIKAEKLIGISEVNYLLGDLTQEEFETEEAEYEALKDDAADALASFSETLYSFDRLTCGGLSKFFEGTAQENNNEAISLIPVIRRGCIYTIRPIIDSEEFLLSIDVPDDFYAETGINITHFELYCDGNKIGKKTKVGENLRHLMLSTQDLGECYIRVYDGNTFIDECLIEPTVFQGPLNIKVGYEEDINAHTLGTYTTSDDVATDMLVLTLMLDQERVNAEYESGNDAAYYRLCVAQDTYVLSDRMVPVDQPFTYLSVLKSDLANVYIELFDSNYEKIGDAMFDTKMKEIYREIDEEEAERLADQKRKEAEERAAREEEEARLASIQEQRDAAAELLKALGMATDEKSISFAMQHINELTYALELKQAQATLKVEHEQDLVKYEEMKADPATKPADLRAMEDRIRITKQMPGIYAKTASEDMVKMLAELDKYSAQYYKELTVKYMVEYNAMLDKSSTNARKETAQATMAEIKEILANDGKGDMLDEIMTKIKTFESDITKLSGYTGETLFAENAATAYSKEFNSCKTIAAYMEDNLYGTSYKTRLYDTLSRNFEVATAEKDSLKKEFSEKDLEKVTYDSTLFKNAEKLDRVNGYINTYQKDIGSIDESTRRAVIAVSNDLKEMDTALKYFYQTEDKSFAARDAYLKSGYEAIMIPKSTLEKQVNDAKKKYEDAYKKYKRDLNNKNITDKKKEKEKQDYENAYKAYTAIKTNFERHDSECAEYYKNCTNYITVMVRNGRKPSYTQAQLDERYEASKK